MAAQMDMHRCIPFLERRGHEHPVADDAGIVDDDMQVAKGIQCCIDDPLRAIPIGDVFIIRDRLAARRLDLFHHRICGRCVTAFALKRSADIIDDDICTFRAKGKRIGPAQSACGAGDDHRSSFTNTHYSLSIIVTLACPPPSHIVCSP